MAHRLLTIALTLGVLATTSPTEVTAQDDPLRGGTFEFGAVVGSASFQSKSDLDGCTWAGIRIGHRFRPLAGVERVQFGFRVGFDGCRTRHDEAGKLDIIHLSLSWLVGVRVSRSWMVYWQTGVGELLGDMTPGPVNEVKARFSVHAGPGVTWALSRHLLLDLAVTDIIYEAFDLGLVPPKGSTFALVPTLMLALQI